MTDSIAQVLRTYLITNYLPHSGAADLKDDQDLFDTGVLDSASALDVLFYVEKQFGVSVPDDDFIPENFASVAATAAYIGNRMNVERLQEEINKRRG